MSGTNDFNQDQPIGTLAILGPARMGAGNYRYAISYETYNGNYCKENKIERASIMKNKTLNS